MSALDALFLLIWCHLLLDYPLQGDFLSKAKNQLAPIPGVPWPTAMWSHAYLQAGPVFLVTGSVICAALEFAAHSIIDWMKCRGWLTFNQDQALHIASKVLWLGLAKAGVP